MVTFFLQIEKNTKFYTISGEVAEITFDENSVSYCYRASNTAEDLQVFCRRFTDQELAVNWESGKMAGQAQVKTTESGGRLASWSWGSTHYTIYLLPLPFPTKSVTQVVTNLMELSYHE